MCDRISDKLNIYEARSLGRFGNQLFDYIFMRLLAINNGSVFKNDIDFPSPFTVPRGSFQQKQKDLGLNYRECIPDFPMDFKYYKDHMSLIKSFFSLPKYTKKYDIVIHIRLDDALKPRETLYTVLPYNFYEEVVDKIKRKHKDLHNFKILCIARPINKKQEALLFDIVEFISSITGADVRTQSGSISEDVSALMSAPIVIGSVGSFWIWPVLLSNIPKEIYVPVFGQNNAYHFFKSLDRKITLEDKSLYPIKVHLKKKITMKSINKMYVKIPINRKSKRKSLKKSIKYSLQKLSKSKTVKNLNYRVVFTGIARNIEHDMPKTLRNIKRLNNMFKNPEDNYFIAYENDSDDRTLELLPDYDFPGHKIIITEKNIHNKYKNRTERIAHARNKVLDAV